MPEDFDLPQINPEKQADQPAVELKQIKPNTNNENVEASEKMLHNNHPLEEGGMNIKKMKRFPKIKFNLTKKQRKIVIYGVGGLAVIMLFLSILIAAPAYATYKKGMKLADSARSLKDSVNSQDISVVKAQMQTFRSDLNSFEKSYNRLTWMKIMPYVGHYISDGQHGIKAGQYGLDTAEIIIQTVEPYADIIGFAGANSREANSPEDTANDRIEFLVQTIDEVLPHMDEIIQKATLANAELQKIDPEKYPEKFRGRQVRSNLKEILVLSDEATSMIADSKPLLEQAPYMLGLDGKRTYLLLFQNDKELRATGGFITAYSILDVENGKISPVVSSDIYNLDNNYRPHIDAPSEMVDYLKGIYVTNPNMRLRDLNWWPDYELSMETFWEEASGAGIDDVDGIIAVDTHVVVNILDVLGQIGVPGFGNFSTENDDRCDCPQVIYELESFADVEGAVVWSENEPGKIVFAPENYDNRKKIVGPLMNSILSNALGQPKEKLPDLFLAGWKSLTEKHILIYMMDEPSQNAVEKFHIAGKIEDPASEKGDYLHINDSNLGGRKSNLYVTQDVHQIVDISRDGTVTKSLEITYKNPKEYDGWLNSVLPNWTRIYVPKGSEVIEVEGFDKTKESYEEFGKTVIAGGFELRPEGVRKVTVTYKLPFKVDDYEIFIQKQPGKDMSLYSIEVGKQLEEFFLSTDRKLRF